MRLLYCLLHYAAMPLFAAHLLWRGYRNRAYLQRWTERLGFGPALGGATLWVHAVSVGEVQAALPLIRGLLEHYPDHRILVTTTTPTGFERLKSALGDIVAHRYVPYDLPGAVNRFLDRADPRAAIILETELWPNILHSCRVRSIPVLLANVRLSDRSASGYRRVHGLVRGMLGDVSRIAAQSEADAARLVSLGAEASKISVTGSIKFDTRLPASLHEEAQALRRVLGVARSVWIAASTHEGEDEQVLDAFARVLGSVPDCLLVLVPRHPERFARVAALCRKRGFHTVLRSDKPQSCEAVDVFIGDTMGELPMFYAAADVAFVGGSLVEIGGHNMLEPAALGLPVLFGPHVFNFAEISRRLKEVGAAREALDSRALGDAVMELLHDANLRHTIGQKGRDFVSQNRGARERLIAIIDELLTEGVGGLRARSV